MKLSTKSLATLLSVAMSPAMRGETARERQFARMERILQKHDRKGELKASVLGIDPVELRTKERKRSLRDIIRSSGFRDENGYRIALIGKIKYELHQRGWTSRKISDYVASRAGRFA